MHKKPEDMTKISEFDLYNIGDLLLYWESGWERLAHVGRRQCPHKLIHFGDISQSPLEWVRLVVYEVFCSNIGLGKNLMVPKSNPAYDAALNLAASSNKKPYGSVTGMYSASRFGFGFSAGNFRLGTWAEDEKKWQKTLEKVLDVLATSSTYREAFLKIATNKKNLSRFTDFWSGQDVRWSKGEYLEASIEPRLKEMMKWLRKGLRSKKACEEAWWNCLWLYMQPTVETMLEIKKKIHDDIPLWSEQIDTINSYISQGMLWLERIPEDDKHKLRMILYPFHYIKSGGNPFSVMSTALLVPPAFDLAQKLQNTFPESRFLQQCHAPSCGKYFYTNRKSQVVCRSTVKGQTSDCRKEWFSYMRRLKNLGKDPTQDWNNSNLIKHFLKQ